MELKLFIEKAAAIAGNQKTLAQAMGISCDYLAHAKAGRRGLPLNACLTLAELLEVDPVLVIYASSLSTRKAGKKTTGKPAAIKRAKSAHLATPSMRLLSSGVNTPTFEPSTRANREAELQKAYEALDLTNDPGNFYKLLFRVPVV
jgi:hypothetical protein